MTIIIPAAAAATAAASVAYDNDDITRVSQRFCNILVNVTF